MAFQQAIAKEGVAVVALSGSTARLDTGLAEPAPHNFTLETATYAPSATALDEVARLIDEHERITIYCGAGVREAHDQVIELARRLMAPIGHTLRAKEIMEHDNPYDVGLTGLIGFGGCTKALKDADLVLLVGTDFPYREYLPETATIVQIDDRPEQLGRRSRLDYGVAGDAGLAMSGLAMRVKEKSDDTHLRAALKVHEEARRKLDVYVRHSGGQSPVHPEFVAATLSRLADSGRHLYRRYGHVDRLGRRYLDMTAVRRLIGSFNHGSMANAIPQASAPRSLSRVARWSRCAATAGYHVARRPLAR